MTSNGNNDSYNGGYDGLVVYQTASHNHVPPDEQYSYNNNNNDNHLEL